MPDIRLDQMVVGYGKVEIVRGIDLHAPASGITCVFGPNGSGKSTLLKAIVGLAPVWRGQVRYGDHRLDGQPLSESIRHGLSVVSQGGNVFPQLTVRENLRMGAYIIPDRRGFEARLEEILALFPVLREKLTVRGSALSGGQRMLLSVAQALMTSPDFILLDEPSAGLSPAAVRDVFQVLGQLRAQGKGILLVEQNVRDALAIADHVYVLVQGRTVFSGAASDVPDAKALVRVYMQA